MQVGLRYEVGLNPPLIVDNTTDGRLISISPIVSSPYGEQGGQVRTLVGGGDRDLLHEFQNLPGAVPTKLQLIIYDYEKPFDFALPFYVASSTSEYGQFTPLQIVPLDGVPAGATIELTDTSLLASNFTLSYRLKGNASFVRVNKTTMPFTLPSGVDAIRLKFRVGQTGGMWSYYGIKIAGVTRYFSVGTNPELLQGDVSLEVEDVHRITEPFGSDSENLTFDYDYTDVDDENYVSVERDGDDVVATALDTGTITVYVNAHPTDYSVSPGNTYVDQSITTATANRVYRLNRADVALPNTGFVQVIVDGNLIGVSDIQLLRRMNTWTGGSIPARYPYTADVFDYGGKRYFVGHPGPQEWSFGTDEDNSTHHVVFRDIADRPTGERRAYRFTIRNKVSNEQLIEGKDYNIPRIPFEVGEMVKMDITGYVGNLTNTPVLTNSHTNNLRATVAKENSKWILTLVGIGTLTTSTVEATVGVSQASTETAGSTLTFDIPVLIKQSVTGSTTAGGTGLYSLETLSEGLTLPRGIVSLIIDLSKYNWFNGLFEGLTTLQAGTFIVSAPDANLATATINSLNPTQLVISTDSTSTESGITTIGLDVHDENDDALGQLSFNITIPDITGRVVEPDLNEQLDYPRYQYVDDPIIPKQNFVESVQAPYDAVKKELVIAEMHGYLGSITKDSQGRWNITERGILDTRIKEKLLDSRSATRDEEGFIFGLLSQFANRDRVVRWPVEIQTG